MSERTFARRLSCCLVQTWMRCRGCCVAVLKWTDSKAPRLPLSGHAHVVSGVSGGVYRILNLRLKRLTVCVCVWFRIFVRCYKLLFVLFWIGQSSDVCTKSCIELQLRLGLNCFIVISVVIITPRVSGWTSSCLLLIVCQGIKATEIKTSFARGSTGKPVNPDGGTQVPIFHLDSDSPVDDSLSADQESPAWTRRANFLHELIHNDPVSSPALFFFFFQQCLRLQSMGGTFEELSLSFRVYIKARTHTHTYTQSQAYRVL